MKRVLLISFWFPILSLAQQTYVPDDNFEQALINLGVDQVFNDSVETNAIDTITHLYLSGMNISDLTGIEEFISLTELFCFDNQLTFLDLSNNSQLIEVSCGNNQLISMDVRNSNNQGLWYFTSLNNSGLNCIDVDDVSWADYTWMTDIWTSFNTNCNPSVVNENYFDGELKKMIDILGREVETKNQIVFYIYHDGTVEKRIVID